MSDFPSAVQQQLFSIALCHFRNFYSTRAFVNNPDVTLLMFESVDIVELQRLTQINRKWRYLGRQALRKRIFLELRQHIKPDPSSLFTATDDPVNDVIFQFLALLTRTHSVVSGSTALAVCMQMTDRAGNWMDARDLDIFTPQCEARNVVEHLVQKLAYTVTEYSLSRTVGGSGFSEEKHSYRGGIRSYDAVSRYNLGIFSVTRLTSADGRRIDVMESASECALLPFTHFPLTHLMNYITGTTLVVSFPWQTLVKRKSLINPDLWEGDGRHLQSRYAERGWPMMDFMHSDRCSKPGYNCPHKLRVSEDNLCLSFQFIPQATGDNRGDISYVPRAMWIWGEGSDEDFVHIEYIPHGHSIVWSLYDHLP